MFVRKTFCTRLVPKPKQPQCGSLPVSRTGEESLVTWALVVQICGILTVSFTCDIISVIQNFSTQVLFVVCLQALKHCHCAVTLWQYSTAWFALMADCRDSQILHSDLPSAYHFNELIWTVASSWATYHNFKFCLPYAIAASLTSLVRVCYLSSHSWECF